LKMQLKEKDLMVSQIERESQINLRELQLKLQRAEDLNVIKEKEIV
jgi:hypothetical protein